MESTFTCSRSHAHNHDHVNGTMATPLLSKSSSKQSRNYSTAGSDLFIEPTPADPLTAQAIHQVAHDIHEYGLIKERLNWFLVYIMAILLYLGLNAALLVANSRPQEFIEEHYEYGLHIISFWGVFLFTVVEATLLIATGVVNWNNKIQSSIVMFDVCMSFVSATLYTLDPETFEVPSHYVEYIVQIPITCVNMIFANRSFSQVTIPSVQQEEDTNPSSSLSANGINYQYWITKGLSYAVLSLSFLQLLLYSGIPEVEMGPERSAHFVEFTNEIFNGIFALEYAIMCYNEWKEQLDNHNI